MEGDAGTSRLNPTGPEPDASDSSDARSEQTQEQNVDTDADDGVHGTPTEDAVDADDLATERDADAVDFPAEDVVERRAERFGSGWLAAICLVLVVLTAGLAVGGYFAYRAHSQSATFAREDQMALDRAKECVAATQAPDVNVLTASQSKIIECSTGSFAVQANLYTGIMAEAYKFANVGLKVSDMRSAIEKHNDDGSVDVLVAVRVSLSNMQAANQEVGYRLRVNMAPEDGTYKISNLEQVTS